MPRDALELVAQIAEATESGFRGRLLARGQAQSMIRRDGALPDDSQDFGPYLDQDLLEYGYSLMSTALRILETDLTQDGSSQSEAEAQIAVARNGFLQASYALEAATRNADPDTTDLAFHRLISGAASHLAGYAARAFSLVETSRSSSHLAPMEVTLADLVMRDLGSIEERTMRLRSSLEVTDEALTAALARSDGRGVVDEPDETSDGEGHAGVAAGSPEEIGNLGPMTLLLSEHYLSSVSTALFAIAFGRETLLGSALADLQLGEDASSDIAAPGPWWVFRLTKHMVADISETSIRRHLPLDPPDDTHVDEFSDAQGGLELRGDEVVGLPIRRTPEEVERRWRRLRLTYVAALLARDRSEIDLWPSQLHVVDRIFANTDDLVVALPTSAGKTRIAELCILRCLAENRRAVYVTPLRALSAQTERVLGETFAPLGARVSSLYGSMGASNLDEDVLRMSDIVVATPEKLDFALRSNPSVLDDVGVVILDEGHMIGAEEREVRYEAQIQRLLRRADADVRRIVCLSAVFPDNEELDDFVEWITRDEPNGLHKENWRPTRQQFGLVEWRSSGFARLSITVGDDQPFIPRYFEQMAPIGKRKNPFPQDQNEMTLATAWRLVEEGQTVLIFCPLRVSVGTLASLIVKLNRQGLLESILPVGVDISNALAIGGEWFGDDHDILECLRLGVAIHHGALPAPFRREVEQLLHQRCLNVTVASPTLAQGLNLSASVVLFSSLHRHGNLLKGAEFANVIGRAGRAFTDTEGLVLYSQFEPRDYKRRNWMELVNGSRARSLESGLVVIGRMLLTRMKEAVGASSLHAFVTYLTGGVSWALPVVVGEGVEDQEVASGAWSAGLSRLDTAILSVVGDETADPEDTIQVLADAMRDSLWERQMRRLHAVDSFLLRTVVEERARHLWRISTPEQRRGWYLAGLGADAGAELGLNARSIVDLTVAAEISIASGDMDNASAKLVQLAEQVFGIAAFKPSVEVRDWRAVLTSWLGGNAIGDVDEKRLEVAQFIESDIVYRLVWGIEAARVYEVAQGNPSADLIDGSAAAALETGTLNRSAGVLIRAGFDHRLAAIKAVNETEANFTNVASLREWLEGLGAAVAADSTWPTVASRGAWVQFAARVRERRTQSWGQRKLWVDDVRWDDGECPEDGTWMRVTRDGPRTAGLWSPGFNRLGTISVRLSENRAGVLHAISRAAGSVELRYRGPNDWLKA